jgi:Uma2 family endonuclease
MRHEIPTPPRTMMEVFQMLPEGTLAELINGSLYMSPAPTTNHQKIIRDLFLKIYEPVSKSSLGELLFSPCDVFLDETSNAVQPDIIYVSKKRLSIIKEDAIHGVPDLLIEVLSAGNSNHDLVRKKELYQEFGVQEYWIVDPETKESIGFTLKNNIYIECGRFPGKIVSPLLRGEFLF